ncbi:MAG: preprotein translocase subunit SecG [Bacteroidota bacterium]|nr:preprotein translocase subunit SecG [Bacteroidota bacterium]
MFGILVFIEIIVSVILMVVVLMQSSKGGGLAGSFGGAQMGTVFGVRRTADFLSRATTILATIFIALSIIINMFFLPVKTTTTESIIQRGSTPTAAPRPLPPASQPAATPQEQGK